MTSEKKRKVMADATLNPDGIPVNPLEATAMAGVLASSVGCETALNILTTDSDVRSIVREKGYVVAPDAKIAALIERVQGLNTRAGRGYGGESYKDKVLQKCNEFKAVFESVGVDIPAATKKKLFEGNLVSNCHYGYDATRRHLITDGMLHIACEDSHQPYTDASPYHTYVGGSTACDVAKDVCLALGVDPGSIQCMPEMRIFGVKWGLKKTGDDAEEDED